MENLKNHVSVKRVFLRQVLEFNGFVFWKSCLVSVWPCVWSSVYLPSQWVSKLCPPHSLAVQGENGLGTLLRRGSPAVSGAAPEHSAGGRVSSVGSL